MQLPSQLVSNALGRGAVSSVLEGGLLSGLPNEMALPQTHCHLSLLFFPALRLKGALLETHKVGLPADEMLSDRTPHTPAPVHN